MKRRTVTYYKTPEGYVGLTNDSPRGFKGIIFVGKGPKGGGPETVCEQAYPTTQMKDWEEMDALAVPDDWFEAIGYEERVKPVAPQPEAEEMKLEIVFPWEGPRPEAPKRSKKVAWIGLAACAYVILWVIIKGCI